MDILNIILTLVSGIIGGNVAGSAMSPEKNLGTLGNSLAGLVGGGLGNFILKSLGVLAASGLATGAVDPATGEAAANLDWSHIIGTILGGGVSGGVLTAIIGLIKDAAAKK